MPSCSLRMVSSGSPVAIVAKTASASTPTYSSVVRTSPSSRR